MKHTAVVAIRRPPCLHQAVGRLSMNYREMSGLTLLNTSEAAIQQASLRRQLLNSSTFSMLEILQKGGPLMWIILLCSVVAVGVFFERLFYLHRISIRVGEFLEGISILLQRGHQNEALQECMITRGPVARVLQAALEEPEADHAFLKEITTDAGLLELPNLERNLSLLSMLAYLTPLIGLLGTVLGLLDAFLAISAHSGYATTAEIAKGVFESLLTTAAGLAVAIPAFLAYAYLSSRVNDLIHDMERAGIEIVKLLTQKKN